MCIRDRHVAYPSQLEMKKQRIIDALKKTPLSLHVHDVQGMQDPYHYRNKMIIGFSRNNAGDIISGLYEESSHRIVSAVSYTHLDVYKRQLQECEFAQTSLSGIHLESNDINGITVSFDDLKGIYVSREQALQLVSLLDIHVCDEE